MGRSGLNRTGDFQKFCGTGLDRIQLLQARIGLGLKNFTVRSFLAGTTLVTPDLQYCCNLSGGVALIV